MKHIAETDDELMEKYLEGEEFTMEEIEGRHPQSHYCNNTMVPVVCGTAYRNKGVQKLLDAIVDYMPAPTDIDHIKGINPETHEEEEERPLLTTSRSRRWRLRSPLTLMWVSCASSGYIPVR